MNKPRLKSQPGPDLVRFPDCEGMRALVRTGGKGSSREEIGQAQDLAYDAAEAPDRARCHALARKALQISPLCADAWLELANLRNLTLEARREYLVRAVCAGQLAVGERRFVEDKGHFWLVMETRPYMRARFALAQDLWFSGSHEAAIGHLRAMLELNPNDNQGLRYTLLTWLMWTADDTAARGLLSENRDEISTFFEFTRALLAFKENGDSETARQAAADATLSNRHIGRYLADPTTWYALSGTYSPGQESEAAWYTQELGFVWQRTPGAIAWICEQMAKEPVRNRDGETVH